MTSPRNRLEQRAKKRFKEFKKGSEQVERAADAMNKLVMRLVVEGRPHPETIRTAERIARQIKALYDAVELLVDTWSTGTSSKAASELAHALAPIEPEPRQRIPSSASKSSSNHLLRGSSRCVPIATILGFLASQSKTGTLRVTTDSETFTFELDEGDVIDTSTDRPPRDQLLGHVLVEQGAINEEQLDAFLRRHGKSPAQLGEALEHGELVSEEQLQAALETQVQQRFDRMFSAEEATFYYSEHARAKGTESVRMNVTQLLLESARKSDEIQQTKPAAAVEEDSWSTPKDVTQPTDWKPADETTDGPGSWDSPLSY